MKRILIVGASSGIGKRVARDFARIGWRVGVSARREEPLKELQKDFPDSVVYKTLDVTAEDAVERFNNLIEMLGGMDVMLYAAGTGFQNPDLDITREVVTLETNVIGMAKMSLAAYRYYRDTNPATPGRIAVITSVAATKGIGIAAAYSASKRFQRTYLEALEQLSHRQKVNVRFTDIRPGFIRTPLLMESRDYPMLMSLDYAAPMIEVAILKGRRVETVDWRWRLLCVAWNLIPSSWWVRMPIDTLSSEATPSPAPAPEKVPTPLNINQVPDDGAEKAVQQAATGIVDHDAPIPAPDADAEAYLNAQPERTGVPEGANKPAPRHHAPKKTK